MTPSVYSRGDWGAAHGIGGRVSRPLRTVVIHHTATESDPGRSLASERSLVGSIERHHALANGWAGIGYNWIVTLGGRIYEGRGWGRVGAHVAGHNSQTVGIAVLMHGNVQSPTPAAVEAIRWLIAEGARSGFLIDGPQVVGHRDLGQTECPGDSLYAVLPQLREPA